MYGLNTGEFTTKCSFYGKDFKQVNPPVVSQTLPNTADNPFYKHFTARRRFYVMNSDYKRRVHTNLQSYRDG